MIIDKIKNNKKLRDEGKFLGIPMFEIFPKLEEELPSIPPGSMILVSAATGIGKSKFARYLVKAIYTLYKNYLSSGKDPGFEPEFLVFLTEESKDEFKLALISSLVWEHYKYKLSRLDLLSMKKVALTAKELEMVEGVRPYLEEVLSFITINDSVYHPYGIYYQCKEYSKEVGIHYYTDLQGKTGKYMTHIEFDGLSDKNRVKYKYSHYIQNNPRKHYVVLVDNMNNFSLEKSHGGDLRNAINDWSRKYAKQQLSMHWKWSVINVIQQSMVVEQKQFTNKGDQIQEKLKPTIAGLGNSKECARDHEVFIGLFKPAKYGIKKYEGYDTSKMCFHTSFITAIFEKNRLGADTFELALHFDGATEDFRELPDPETANKLMLKYLGHVR